MKLPKISLKYLVFLIASYLLAHLYIGNSTFTFGSLPSIIYTLTGSSISGGILAFLTFLMAGIYKGAPQIIAARISIALAVAIGIYLFGLFYKKYENSNLAVIAITVLPSLLTFFIIRYFYNYEAAMSISRTLIITLAINTFLALIIEKVINMPDQKGVIAKWFKQ